MSFLQAALVFTVVAPGIVFGALSILWLAGWEPKERWVTRVTAATYSSCVLALGILIFGKTAAPIVVTFGTWFAVGEYHFPLELVADGLSLSFLVMTVVLAGLIGKFSSTYLHRERGFFRFFLLLHLFSFGSQIAFAAGSFDLLVAGWEIVGITSVVLVAFFHHRPAPVENGLRVFGVYRACDMGLLVGVVAMHQWAGTASFLNGVPKLTTAQALIVCLLLLFAASGKAAQVPFSGWLPRAMEGPTPSSAIFYGAISIHAGAYLLLRIQPIIQQVPLASTLVISIGVATAIYGTLVGRASADAKTFLAQGSLTQVGIIFAEIGMGWTRIAVIHVLGHAAVRTLQFLRAPSMLHDYHHMHSALGGQMEVNSRVSGLLPEPVKLWLYRWALDRGHLDSILDRFILDPLVQLSRLFAKADAIGFSRRPRRRERTAILVRISAEQESNG